ncbi:S-adenosyl-L-methionine-dependent methyltransferase [Rhexocercosporidium sp. MPI-PUGE-AT-0058]|nr:S-adenosyl-L-methionine-dependent methyltransferase [Rhexocercosporidium sp. MPI-PUGE-AT-0058]
MTESQDPRNLEVFPHGEEIPERLDEQHIFTTQTLGFVIHPNISQTFTSPTVKIADIGTGTGIWILDVSSTLPTAQLTGYDISSDAFPNSHPSNVSFKTHDMLTPFPDSEIGTYDLVAIRFVSVATPREEWKRAISNLLTLLKPGGWLQWIDSCNFALYNSTPGTSRAACREIWDGLQPLREKEDPVIGMMMSGGGDVHREEIWRDLGLEKVHEDIFSTDRIQDQEMNLREKGTKNAIVCFLGCLEGFVSEREGWSKRR